MDRSEKVFGNVAFGLKLLTAQWTFNWPFALGSVREEMLLNSIFVAQCLRTFRALGGQVGVVVSTEVGFKAGTLAKDCRTLWAFMEAIRF